MIIYFSVKILTINMQQCLISTVIITVFAKTAMWYYDYDYDYIYDCIYDGAAHNFCGLLLIP